MQKRACPSAGYGHFPTLQPGATSPTHDSYTAGFPITSMKVPFSPALKRRVLGRGVQVAYIHFLSKIEKKQQQTPTFYARQFLLVRTFARVSAVKTNLMPLKNINLSLKALSVDLP